MKNKITKEQIEELKKIANEMQKNHEENKNKFVKELAEQIVLKMVELGYTPKPKERDYIN